MNMLKSGSLQSKAFELSLRKRPVQTLLENGIVLSEEWEETPAPARKEMEQITDLDQALKRLLQEFLLTQFQADLIRIEKGLEILIGPYRLLNELGRGGMGVVYRAEHCYLRRPVALKVMTDHAAQSEVALNRFYLEARAVAMLRHPGIVYCLDAGQDQPRSPKAAVRDYYAMELISGVDLQQTVDDREALPVHRAADLIRQIAEALAEAHRIGLVHRDIKPSNIMVTPDGKAMLLDFGLARHPSQHLTRPGTILGTLGYVAPEQVSNPSCIDGRADLFSLGASLYFALTGTDPFPASSFTDLNRRLHSPPPRIRERLPNLPAGLDELVAKLMNCDPNDRFPSAASTAAALIPYSRCHSDGPGHRSQKQRPHVLIVDSDPEVRVYLRSLLDADYNCHEAEDGEKGLDLIEDERYDLILVDQEMGHLNGMDFIAGLHELAPAPCPRVLSMSSRPPTASLGDFWLRGADDFICKPFNGPELLSRVRNLLVRNSSISSELTKAIGLPSSNQKLASASELPAIVPAICLQGDNFKSMASQRTREMAGQRRWRQDRETSIILPSPDTSLNQIRLLSHTVCRILEERGILGRGYCGRLPQYIESLGQGARDYHNYSGLHDPDFLARLSAAALLHDIGTTTLTGKMVEDAVCFEPDEKLVMQTHTSIGAEMLCGLVKMCPDIEVLPLAVEIALSHHERWDGSGYPNGLKEESIPIAARLVGVASVYDTIRSQRLNHLGQSHHQAVRVITSEAEHMFDPNLVAAFRAVADHFDYIFESSFR